MAQEQNKVLGKWQGGIALTILIAASLAILAVITVSNPADAATTSLSFEAEKMRGGGKVFYDRSASKNRAKVFYKNGRAVQGVRGAIRSVVVRAKGDSCGRAARMKVMVDGKNVMVRWVKNQKRWRYHAVRVTIPHGFHKVEVKFINDYQTRRCDRNLRVDKVRITRSTVTKSTNPFSGEKLYVDPNSRANEQTDEWRNSRPEDAKQMEKIAHNPVVQYYSTWANQKHVDNYISSVTAAGKLPVIGIYAVPNRDCGSYSAGGFSGAAQYRTWIDEVAAGIGSRKTVVIVEPDAVAGWDCLSSSQREERVGVLKYAVQKLKSNPSTYVYIDAGHPRWHTVEATASRLRQVNIDLADGFTLNHSNFFRTADNIVYGKKVSALVGGKHFVIDTSRNGNGPTADYNWCNPPGRALGPRPTANTGEPLVDAFFWLKTPGESDGPCGGYPGGGAWLPEYALGLAQRAAY